MKMGSEVYHNLKKVISSKYGQDACNVGDEGGFAPNIGSNEEGLNLVNQAIEAAGFTGKVKVGMDVAASEFLKDGKYDLDFKTKDNDGSKVLTGKEEARVCFGRRQNRKRREREKENKKLTFSSFLFSFSKKKKTTSEQKKNKSQASSSSTSTSPSARTTPSSPSRTPSTRTTGTTPPRSPPPGSARSSGTTCS